MVIAYATDFESWRNEARYYLSEAIPPETVTWLSEDKQQLLFESRTSSSSKPKIKDSFSVPKSFIDLARFISCHNDAKKWSLLYLLLWRIAHGERNLLQDPSDPLVLHLDRMKRQVRFDRHKMTAFVRFRETSEGTFLAWYKPEHHVVELALPFFKKRFGEMKWALLTPYISFYWDTRSCVRGKGVEADPFAGEDSIESLWKEYYRSIFNPARIKIKMMKREMPVRYWESLPETSLISSMIQEAPQRVEVMRQRMSTAAHVPPVSSLEELRAAGTACRACSLCLTATQTVFGEGNARAPLMIIGEQPGDHEDITGRPFVGPAGTLLRKALAESALCDSEMYVTNAVKHFKFEERGKRRIHKKPSGDEISTCKPWLVKEIDLLSPSLIICLGQTAALSLLGELLQIRDCKDKIFHYKESLVRVTYHPSAILRQQNPESSALLYNDLRTTLLWAREELNKERISRQFLKGVEAN